LSPTREPNSQSTWNGGTDECVSELNPWIVCWHKKHIHTYIHLKRQQLIYVYIIFVSIVYLLSVYGYSLFSYFAISWERWSVIAWHSLWASSLAFLAIFGGTKWSALKTSYRQYSPESKHKSNCTHICMYVRVYGYAN